MSKTPRDRSTDLRDSNNSFKSFNNVSINKTVSEDSSGIRNQKYPNQGQVEIKMLVSSSYDYPITSSHCLLSSLYLCYHRFLPLWLVLSLEKAESEFESSVQ